MRDIFEMDRDGIDQADLVLACMDGTDPDSGTCWECGYAYAKGKPTILYRTDFRGQAEGKGFAPFNLMLAGSAQGTILHNSLCESFDTLVDRIEHQIRGQFGY